MTKPTVKPKRSGRLSADDWAEAALQQIERLGVDGLAVEPLAIDLGVTKGSFYWHFPNRDALLEAALQLWERRETDDIIDQVQKEDDPRRRYSVLLHEVVGRRWTSRLYFQLAAAAPSDERLNAALDRVIRRRIDFLEECFRALGGSPEQAHYRALTAYAVYVGYMHLGLPPYELRFAEGQLEILLADIEGILTARPKA